MLCRVVDSVEWLGSQSGHNSEYCGHRSKHFHKSNTIFQMKAMLKYISNVFSENKYVLVQISAITGRGDFKNSTNVAHTQIQLMMVI